jgi:glycosyltransferase involved in cell wall biosynthesis
LSGVLVSHPHVAAVSAGVAASLARAGRLSLFVAGVAFNGSDWTGRIGEALAERRPVLRNRIVRQVPSAQLRALPLVELGARGAARVLRAAGAPISSYDALYLAHDAAVAFMPWPGGTTAVYAYEDGAYLTFRRAARKEMARILDVASLHYRTMESIWRQEIIRWPDAVTTGPRREPPWKQRRKDAELALATTVSVASTFTRRSLEGQGLRAPVVVTPYGFPTDLFPPKTERPGGKLTVLAVGGLSLPKGTAYLLEAWKRAALPDAELHLVGRMHLAKSFVDRYAGLYRHWPHVPRTELAARYATADLLVFPTLADGFGLVMQEAMCCATPVLTTPSGGGPECITDGVEGWLIPPADVDALVERLRSAAANRDALHAMGLAARARAERWTWTDAGQSLVRSLGI